MTCCCEMMKDQLGQACVHHDRDPFECPDQLVIRTPGVDDGFGLIIHDGGSSFIGISYCPWCGQALNSAAR